MRIFDRMYKEMKFPPMILELLNCPGLLRLKDVRMANNQFVAFPAFANTSRYEHSLGVCHLAEICADKLHLNEKDKLELMIASLYHDVGTPPFAHAMEEVLQATFGFDHEENLYKLIVGKTDSFDGEFAQIYQDMSLKLKSVCQKKEAVSKGISLTRIAKIAIGAPEEPLSPLLNSKGMDLDNIDNIYRASTAMGIIDDDGGKSAETLAKAFCYKNGEIFYDEKYHKEILRWQQVRDIQYNAIFESNEDFAYQTMIKKAISKLGTPSKEGIVLDKYSWRMTDSTFTNNYLLQHSESKNLMKRVMLCRPYQLITIFYVSGVNAAKYVNIHLKEIEKVASKYYGYVIFPDESNQMGAADKNKEHDGDGIVVANYYLDKRKRSIGEKVIPGGAKIKAQSNNIQGVLLGLFTDTPSGYGFDDKTQKRRRTYFRYNNIEELKQILRRELLSCFEVTIYNGDNNGTINQGVESGQLGLFRLL